MVKVKVFCWDCGKEIGYKDVLIPPMSNTNRICMIGVYCKNCEKNK